VRSIASGKTPTAGRAGRDTTLDVETPDPPTLSGAQDPGDYDAIDESEDAGDDYRREALAEFLDEGVWAAHDWADCTSLTEAEFRAVLDADLVDGFGCYWTPSAEGVGHRAPAVPTDLSASPDRDDVRGAVGDPRDDQHVARLPVANGVSLGRTVSEVLENDCVGRSSEAFGYDWE